MTRKNEEAALQRQVCEFLRLALDPAVLWTGIENKPRSRIAGAQQKARGVRAGVPDILFWFAAGFGAIELKTIKRRVSDEQEIFREEFTARGGLYAVCRSIEDVESSLRHWGLPMKGSSGTRTPL